MTLEDSIHSQRLRVLREAERLGNVSEACRRHGVSRTVFYRLAAATGGSTARMASIPNGARRAAGARRRCRCRRSGA